MLNVLRGKVRATTREENMYTDKAKDGQANTFQVRTKSAVAGVRGTDFLTSFDAKSAKMEVVTFRGKVEVGQLGAGGKITNSVTVAVGQKTEVVGGKAPSVPKALPAGELMKQNNESHNEGSSSGSSASNGSAPAKGDDKRSPASQGPNTMLHENDLPGPGGGPQLPPMPPAPPAPPPLPPNVNSNLLINNAIQSKKATVNLNLRIK